MNKLPRLSLITITYDKPYLMPICIHNINTINYPKELLEWVIIDDGDKPFFSEDILNETRKTFPNINIIYKKITNKFSNILQKREAGILSSTSDYFGMLDPDTLYTPNHFLNCVELLLNKKRKIGLTGHSNSIYFQMKETNFYYEVKENQTDYNHKTIVFTKKFWKIIGGCNNFFTGYESATLSFSEKNTETIILTEETFDGNPISIELPKNYKLVIGVALELKEKSNSLSL